MKEYRDEMLTSWYDEEYINTEVFKRLSSLVKEVPRIFAPVRGGSEDAKIMTDRSIVRFNSGGGYEHLRSKGIMIEREPILYIKGFYLIPTVEKTTLFYEEETDCFLKIIHPVKARDKIKGIFCDRAERICRIANDLREAGLRCPEIVSCGRLRGMRYFYLMKRVKGVSLNYLCCHRKEEVTLHLMKRVMSMLAGFHMRGLWHGDMRLSHLFVYRDGGLVIIDIDSIRRNPFLFKRKMAKDLAGINHPDLPLSHMERLELFNHYVMESGLGDVRGFLELIGYYSERRWGLKI